MRQSHILNRMVRAASAVLAALLVIAVWPAAGAAQEVDEDGFAVVSDAQAQLNVSGIEAMKAGDYVKATRLFRSALDLAPLNVTYLNLGRALTRSGQCEEAVSVYDKVLDAPKVRQPSPETVKAKLVEYRAELAELCPGKMAISCTPIDMMVSIDDAEPVRCPVEPLVVKSGTHSVVGQLDGQRVSLKVTVTSMETTDVELELDHPQVPDDGTLSDDTGDGTDDDGSGDDTSDDPSSLPPTPDEGMGGTTIAGIALTSVGGAALLTAVILEMTVLQGIVDDLEAASDADDLAAFEDHEADLDTMSGVNIGLYAGGGALLATGIILIAVDAAQGGEAAGGSAQLTPWATSDGAGAAWTLEW